MNYEKYGLTFNPSTSSGTINAIQNIFSIEVVSVMGIILKLTQINGSRDWPVV